MAPKAKAKGAAARPVPAAHLARLAEIRTQRVEAQRSLKQMRKELRQDARSQLLRLPDCLWVGTATGARVQVCTWVAPLLRHFGCASRIPLRPSFEQRGRHERSASTTHIGASRRPLARAGQENRRHARLRKKASKLDVADLLEIAALKGLQPPGPAAAPGVAAVALHAAGAEGAVAVPAPAPEGEVAAVEAGMLPHAAEEAAAEAAEEAADEEAAAAAEEDDEDAADADQS